MGAATGTIPALPPYQPGALPITGNEQFEITDSASATTAASWRMSLSDIVGKAPSAMGSQSPDSNDLVAVFQKSSGLYFSSTIGNLGIPTGNVPTGGTQGQLLEKTSATNFASGWISLSSLLTASSAITLSGSTTVAVSVTPAGIGSAQLGSFAVQANNIATNVVGSTQFRQSAAVSVVGNATNAAANVSDIAATAGNQFLQSNAGGTGLIFTTFAASLLPGPYQASNFTSNGVVYGQGTSALLATAAGTAGYFLQGQGTSLAPAFTTINLASSGSFSGVLPVAQGGQGTSTLTLNGVLYGLGTTSPLGITAAGTSGWPLVGQGAASAPVFAVLGLAGGGTGTASLTAHGVVIGEGSAALTVAPAATAGFVFAANGPASDPSFQSVASLMISTLTMTGGLSVLGLGTAGGAVSAGSATITNVRLISPKTAAYTVANSDLATFLTYSSAAATTWTIPQASVTVGNAFAAGWFCDIQNLATGILTLQPQTSLINASTSLNLYKNEGLRLVSDGTNYQIQGGGPLAVSLNNTAQIFGGGVRMVAFSLGTTGTGSTITLDSGSGPIQTLVNNGAFTFSAPANDGELDVLVTNTTNASTITFSGWSVGSNTGDAYTTTSGNKFILVARRIGGNSTYAWKALQ